MALVIAYDGTQYHGYQIQSALHGATIQGCLEKAWMKLFHEPVRFTAAGRTDAGVHAVGQVVSFHSTSRIPTDKIGKAMNSLLPRDIRVLKAWETKEDFSARFSAYWKRYDYRLDNRPVPDVFSRCYAHHEPVPLNRDAMKNAAQALAGCHDYRAFAAAGGSSRIFVRTLSHCHIEEEHGLLKMSFVGDGFLYNMVRIMAGTLVALGKERDRVSLPEAESAEEAARGILQSQDRTRAGDTLSAHGLVLAHVEYDGRLPSAVFADLPSSPEEQRLLIPQSAK